MDGVQRIVTGVLLLTALIHALENRHAGVLLDETGKKVTTVGQLLGSYILHEGERRMSRTALCSQGATAWRSGASPAARGVVWQTNRSYSPTEAIDKGLAADAIGPVGRRSPRQARCEPEFPLEG